MPDLDLAVAIAALPARQRAAVALFCLEYRPTEEVAQRVKHASASPPLPPLQVACSGSPAR